MSNLNINEDNGALDAQSTKESTDKQSFKVSTTMTEIGGANSCNDNLETSLQQEHALTYPCNNSEYDATDSNSKSELSTYETCFNQENKSSFKERYLEEDATSQPEKQDSRENFDNSDGNDNQDDQSVHFTPWDISLPRKGSVPVVPIEVNLQQTIPKGVRMQKRASYGAENAKRSLQNAHSNVNAKSEHNLGHQYGQQLHNNYSAHYPHNQRLSRPIGNHILKHPSAVTKTPFLCQSPVSNFHQVVHRCSHSLNPPQNYTHHPQLQIFQHCSHVHRHPHHLLQRGTPPNSLCSSQASVGLSYDENICSSPVASSLVFPVSPMRTKPLIFANNSPVLSPVDVNEVPISTSSYHATQAFPGEWPEDLPIDYLCGHERISHEVNGLSAVNEDNEITNTSVGSSTGNRNAEKLTNISNNNSHSAIGDTSEVIMPVATSPNEQSLRQAVGILNDTLRQRNSQVTGLQLIAIEQQKLLNQNLGELASLRQRIDDEKINNLLLKDSQESSNLYGNAISHGTTCHHQNTNMCNCSASFSVDKDQASRASSIAPSTCPTPPPPPPNSAQPIGAMNCRQLLDEALQPDFEVVSERILTRSSQMTGDHKSELTEARHCNTEPDTVVAEFMQQVDTNCSLNHLNMVSVSHGTDKRLHHSKEQDGMEKNRVMQPKLDIDNNENQSSNDVKTGFTKLQRNQTSPLTTVQSPATLAYLRAVYDSPARNNHTLNLGILPSTLSEQPDDARISNHANKLLQSRSPTRGERYTKQLKRSVLYWRAFAICLLRRVVNHVPHLLELQDFANEALLMASESVKESHCSSASEEEQDALVIANDYRDKVSQMIDEDEKNDSVPTDVWEQFAMSLLDFIHLHVAPSMSEKVNEVNNSAVSDNSHQQSFSLLSYQDKDTQHQSVVNELAELLLQQPAPIIAATLVKANEITGLNSCSNSKPDIESKTNNQQESEDNQCLKEERLTESITSTNNAGLLKPIIKESAKNKDSKKNKKTYKKIFNFKRFTCLARKSKDNTGCNNQEYV